MQLLPSMKSGGVEKGVVEIARAAVQRGHKIIVVSEGGAMVAALEAAGAVHVTLPVASKNPLTILYNARRLQKVIQDYAIDIIHARSRAPAWSGYLAAKKAGCHFMTTFHGVYSLNFPGKKFYNRIMVKGEQVIAASHFILKHIESHYQLDKKRLHLIPRGVDLDQWGQQEATTEALNNLAAELQISRDKPLIILPGRITEWKGHLFLLDALAQLQHDFTCLLVGDDKGHAAYRGRIEKKIQALELQDKVRIQGHMADMFLLYQLSDIVVSASLRPEAFGRVAIEGQAAGKMVVATNHGGSLDTVIPGKTGWLVEPGDATTLAKTLSDIMVLSKEQKAIIADAAKQHILDHFSTEQMVEKTCMLYAGLGG